MTPDQLLQTAKSFQFGPWHLLALVLLIAVSVGLLFTNRAPSVASMRQFVNLLDSRGGNMLVYIVLTIFFFSAAMRIFYLALAMIAAKTLEPSNAVLMMCLQFLTGSAFGGSFSALLKTSTGTDNVRASDKGLPPSGATDSEDTNTGGKNGKPNGTPKPSAAPAAPATGAAPAAAVPAAGGL